MRTFLELSNFRQVGYKKKLIRPIAVSFLVPKNILHLHDTFGPLFPDTSFRMGKQSEKSSKNETEKRICAERKRVAPPPVICRRYPSVG